jgi:hypothetical protein
MARPIGTKNKPGSMKPGPCKGSRKPLIQKTCKRCADQFTGYNGSTYCSRKCLFLANVAPQENGCWTWKGYKRPGGYGEAYFGVRPNRERILAHRLAYEVTKGDPGALLVCHTCDEPSCVNPEHLFLGTIQDNMDDRNRKGRQARGERNGPAKLTEDQVRAIRADPRMNTEIAKDYGVFETTVSTIKHRRTWKHVA